MISIKKEPFLQITIDRESDDLRDQMLKSFVEKINFSTHTIYGQYNSKFEEVQGKSLYNISISEIPPTWASKQRIDLFKSWSKMFLNPGDEKQKLFDDFFVFLNEKAELLIPDKVLESQNNFKNII